MLNPRSRTLGACTALLLLLPAVRAASAQKPPPYIPAQPVPSTNRTAEAYRAATNRPTVQAPAQAPAPTRGTAPAQARPPLTLAPAPAPASAGQVTNRPAQVRPPATLGATAPAPAARTVASPPTPAPVNQVARTNVTRQNAAPAPPLPTIPAPGTNGVRTSVNGTNRAMPSVVGTHGAAAPAQRSLDWVNPAFADLYYGPVPKQSYPNNPRRNVRALYVSLNVLRAERFDNILNIARQTAVDGLVIDYKDDDGRLLGPSAAAARFNPAAVQASQPTDVAGLVKRLRAHNLYLIARIVVFKDPIYAKAHPHSAVLDNKTGQPFKSGDGLTWSSPFNAEFQAYNLALAEEAAAAGFNEVQFDYIRFPDVPRAASLNYRTDSRHSKSRVIQQFLIDARRRLEPRGVYLAADVFGLTCTVKDDMRIGQYWEAVANIVDYICPMMYPSHYIAGNYGLSLPDKYPYELMDRGIRDALKRNARLQYPADLRPWIQGFTASWVKGHIRYGPPQVKAQVRGLQVNNVQSYLVWHPGGKYDLAAY